MNDVLPRADIEAILAEGAWLRRVAACLVHDAADADDLVQEAWLAAIRAPAPTVRGSLRPWLAQIVRNARRMTVRADVRRRHREAAAPPPQPGDSDATDVMLARLELQRLIAAEVKELDEPYRTALLLRFFEGKSPAAIAEAQGVPAGTVRWRISEGLQRLRARMDQRHGGERDRWRALLLPILPAVPMVPPTTTAAGPTGSAVAAPAWHIAFLTATTMTAMVGGAFWLGSGGAAEPPARAVAELAAPAQTSTGAAPALSLAANVPRLQTERAPNGVSEPSGGPLCANGRPCVRRIPRSELPASVDAALASATLKRTPDNLRIEPRVRRGRHYFNIKFEIDGVDQEYDYGADGEFMGMETDVDETDLPAHVAAAARAAVPDGRANNIEFHNEEGDRWYELRLEAGGRDHEVKISEGGALLAMEIEVPFEELPPLVAAGARNAVPGGRPVEAELVLEKGQRRYKIDMDVEGKTFVVKLDEDGRLDAVEPD